MKALHLVLHQDFETSRVGKRASNGWNQNYWMIPYANWCESCESPSTDCVFGRFASTLHFDGVRTALGDALQARSSRMDTIFDLKRIARCSNFLCHQWVSDHKDPFRSIPEKSEDRCRPFLCEPIFEIIPFAASLSIHVDDMQNCHGRCD